MPTRVAVTFVVAVASVCALLGSTAAAEITTVGTVVSTGHDLLIVKIDDHGHKIPFAVGKDTAMPSGLARGSRVSVVYHPTGVTGQAADAVTLLPGAAAKMRRARPAPAPSAPATPKS